MLNLMRRIQCRLGEVLIYAFDVLPSRSYLEVVRWRGEGEREGEREATR